MRYNRLTVRCRDNCYSTWLYGTINILIFRSLLRYSFLLNPKYRKQAPNVIVSLGSILRTDLISVSVGRKRNLCGGILKSYKMSAFNSVLHGHLVESSKWKYILTQCDGLRSSATYGNIQERLSQIEDVSMSRRSMSGGLTKWSPGTPEWELKWAGNPVGKSVREPLVQADGFPLSHSWSPPRQILVRTKGFIWIAFLISD